MERGTASSNSNSSSTTTTPSTTPTRAANDPFRLVPGGLRPGATGTTAAISMTSPCSSSGKRSFATAVGDVVLPSWHNNNSATTDDASSCWSARSENDSTRPVVPEPSRRRRKRRRTTAPTTIVDAFQTISLQPTAAPRSIHVNAAAATNTVAAYRSAGSTMAMSTSSFTNTASSTSAASSRNFKNHTRDNNSSVTTATNIYNNSNYQHTNTNNLNMDDEDADSLQAIADDQDHPAIYSSTSTLEDDEDCDDDDDDDGDDGDLLLLNDQEIQQKQAERHVMFELVFGPDQHPVVPIPDPVDRKLTQLLRKSMHQPQQAQAQQPQPLQEEDTSLDDMTLASVSSLGTNSSNNSNHNKYQPNRRPHRRSHSLPDSLVRSSGGDGLPMDTVGEGDEGSHTTGGSSSRIMSMSMMMD